MTHGTQHYTWHTTCHMAHNVSTCHITDDVTLTAAQCSGVQLSSSSATRLAPFLHSSMIVDTCPEYLPRRMPAPLHRRPGAQPYTAHAVQRTSGMQCTRAIQNTTYFCHAMRRGARRAVRGRHHEALREGPMCASATLRGHRGEGAGGPSAKQRV